MENTVGNYSIKRFVNGNLRIDYKRSLKDLFYISTYILIAIPILFYGFKLFRYLIGQKITIDMVIGYVFAICLSLAGFYFAIVSIETFIKPTKNTFLVDTINKRLVVKVNLFKTISVNFAEINQFHLQARDITIKNYHDGRSYQKQLFLVQMYIDLINGKAIKVHRFESPHLLISFSEKKRNKSLKTISKQIAEIIALECEKKVYWKGVLKE